MNARTRLLVVAGLLSLLAGCFQAQLNGPVSGAKITVSDLRDSRKVYAQLRSESRRGQKAAHGAAAWEEMDNLGRLLRLGTFSLDLKRLQDDRVYLVTASGGADADLDRNGAEDAAYTRVVGRWRAIMSGAQLKATGYKVSSLTEALYQWLEADIANLTDHQILYNLDRAALGLVADVDGSGAVSGSDSLHWGRLFDSGKLLADADILDQITDAIVTGEEGADRLNLSRRLIAITVDHGTPASVFLPGLLENLLVGQPLQKFFDVSWRWLLARSPEAIIELGLDKRYGEQAIALDNISDDHEQVSVELARVVLAGLHDFDRRTLTADEQISYDLYQWYLQDKLEAAQYQLYSYPASSFITGVPRSTLFFFTDIHPLETVKDARGYLARLRLVDDKFEQLRDNVAARAQAGVIEPAVTLDWGIDALRGIADAAHTSTGYYARFADQLDDIAGLTPTQRNKLRSAASKVVSEEIQPAYDGLIADLEALRGRAPQAIGMGQFKGGLQYYKWALRHHSTTAMNAPRIHQLGLDELQRVHAEIETAAAALDYPSNLGLEELYQRIATDSGLLVGSRILETYEDLVAGASQRLPEAFDLLPRQPVVVIGGPTGGFYISGAEDGSRPGAFYAATTGQEAQYSMPSLAYHEAVPGHHLQIALAQEQDLPDFRRYTYYTAFIEGWALYAERLAFELGWYETDAFGNLGRLQFEAIRAARLAVDTGIHHYGWSWDSAVDFYQSNTGSSMRAAQGSVGRFMRWPGQATSYMIGMNKFLELRAEMQARRGADFDIREFHRLMLSGAAMPMGVLRKVVSRALRE